MRPLTVGTAQVQSRIPEEDFWLKMILTAFSDACHKPDPWEPASQSRARKWLLGEVEGLDMVCEMAGVRKDFVIQCAKRVAKKGWRPKRFTLKYVQAGN